MLEPRFAAGTTAKAINADPQDPADTDESEPDHTPDYDSSEAESYKVVAVV
jgi:hypothetical protein